MMSEVEHVRWLTVMVRLDWTIFLPMIALTGVLVPMVRSSRTMTEEEGGRHEYNELASSYQIVRSASSRV